MQQHLFDIDVRVPMRDGVALTANVWRSVERKAPVPHKADRNDGEETVAWITEQPWSDGSVGMYGGSYLGMIPWETAVTGTSNVCLPGHRIRVDISSSNFPRYDRNTNTGGVIAHESEEQMIPAINHIHHGPGHPSRLVLPIIDRKDQS
ncbi:CocE/NonD family hydrolase [Streptomyces sp. NPDC057257]|uniref:CocE/NonD family hydrolase n=1 Tax=Streptomyces sp. NPDC057257 TaxID=3346071 RepID=UPI00362D3B8E